MGGLALKHLGVRRVPAPVYHALAAYVEQEFQSLFSASVSTIPSYRSKEDFGDCDMLYVAEALPDNWVEVFMHTVKSSGFVRNGDVTSIEVAGVQFDFIKVPSTHLHFAYTYFAYNDLGNLMGRIAHKLGFKYGHNGFNLTLRDDHHVYSTIEVSRSMPQVFDFMGYSYAEWCRGFGSLDDVFRFVASSRYFSPEIYLLDNRNAISRSRDAKRKTYMEFLTYCEGLEHGRASHLDKAAHLEQAIERWPDLKLHIDEANDAFAKKKDLASRWNGENVREWTGREGQELGQFMAYVRGKPNFEIAAQEVGVLAAFTKELHTGWKPNPV